MKNLLPASVQKNGFLYTLVLRTDKFAIYKQHYSHCTTYFEVFAIKTRSDRVIKGKLLPEREIFPNNEDFGKSAWVYTSLDKAIAKLRSQLR